MQDTTFEKSVLSGCVLLLLTLGSEPLNTQAADTSALSTTLCSILKTLEPEVRGYRPEGAQAQLVMKTADAFNYDPEKLREVQDKIDQVTTAGCPKQRQAMLAILKMTSLAEAVR